MIASSRRFLHGREEAGGFQLFAQSGFLYLGEGSQRGTDGTTLDAEEAHHRLGRRGEAELHQQPDQPHGVELRRPRRQPVARGERLQYTMIERSREVVGAADRSADA